MAFEQQQNKIIVGIEDFDISLFSTGPSNAEGVEAGQITYQNLMSDGSIEAAKNPINLLVRLTDDAAGLVHLANLVGLRDYVRARLNAEAIPTP